MNMQDDISIRNINIQIIRRCFMVEKVDVKENKIYELDPIILNLLLKAIKIWFEK